MSLLLTGVQRIHLLCGDQRVRFLLGLLPDLFHLLLLLLRRQRRILADARNLRMRVMLDLLMLLHHGSSDAGLFPAWLLPS